MTNVCIHCLQPIKLAHKETLNKSKLTMLQTAATHVKSTMINNFRMRDIGDFSHNPNAYTNWQKLRYHGLIAHITENGERVAGRWLITRNGWSFLRGESELPKYVLVRNNHIIERAERKITVKDVFRGDPAFETTFQYFDTFDNAVGYKPTTQDNLRIALL
jgi:hypothetical protein